MRILLGFMWLLHWLPLPVLGRFGTAVGSLLFVIMKPRRDITLTNLRLTMPHLTEQQREELARRHFQGYARSVFERGILWWASERRLKRLITVVSYDGAHPETNGVPVAAISDKPTILLCPHFVCLDVAGAAIAMEMSASSMYVQQKNKVFDQVLRDGRARFKPVKLFTRHDGIKPILRALKEKLPYFMLPDMDFGEKDAEFVPFFGIECATLTATARIAAATGAQVMPVISTFLPGYRGWQVQFYAPWQNYPGPDMVEATRHMNAFIEDRVREAPAEYFWTHKRFKTRPHGEASLYTGK